MATCGEPCVRLTATERRRGLSFLSLTVAAVGFAMAVQMGLNANFLAEEIGISGLQLGLLEAVRESCGIAALAFLALLAGLSEPVVGSVMLALFAFGLSGYAFTHSYVSVVAVSVVWSQGLHVWMPLPGSMAIGLAEPGRAGHRLGQVRAAGAVGFGVGLVVAYAMTHWGVPMRQLYLWAGGGGLLAAVACLGVPRQIRTDRPRVVFRRRYRLYYVLSFLEGWRKQIFVCFAGFLLVRKYQAPVKTVLLLHCAVQVVGYLASAWVGRLIDRVGERRVLVFYFTCLSAFFVGYATIPVREVLYVLFVVDSSFFVFAMALTTYANRLAPPAERTPTLAMGVAMNHAAAVSMPLLGGFLWQWAGYQWPFAIGAAAALVSIVVALRLPPHEAWVAKA